MSKSKHVNDPMTDVILATVAEVTAPLRLRIAELENRSLLPHCVNREWVNCPICGEPDMRKETDKDGNSLVLCVNHVCASNGGDNADAIMRAKYSRE